MDGKVCVVTGANAGIGKATAVGLAEAGARVVMICRSRERGEAAQAEIKERSGGTAVDLLITDLSVQAQVRRLADQIKQNYDRLDVLINNAGVITRQRQESADGIEMQLAVNHLAPFLLTNLLLDLLKASAPARVITVSSMTHAWGKLDFDDLQNERGYDPTDVYAQTKLMNVLFTHELARRLEGSGVTANSLHPGVIPTKLNADYMGRSGSGASWPQLWEGAQTTLYLATSAEAADVSGKYFVDESPKTSAAASYNEEKARRLWQVSADLTGPAG